MSTCVIVFRGILGLYGNRSTQLVDSSTYGEMVQLYSASKLGNGLD
jgi:hypothetical protein